MARPWPLRTRLIAGILALVALSLLAISVISYVGLNRYLVGRIDQELISTAQKPSILTLRDAPPSGAFVLPTNWLFASKTSNGMGPVFPDLPVKSQPTWPRSATEVADLPRQPYTSRASDGTDWRLLAFYNQEGQLDFLGQSLTDVEGSIHRFLLIQLIVGGGTLLIITAIGAEVIRRSLRPLTQIEAKAAAITAGDLTQRVPEYEPNAEVPKTEVGTLGRTLNTMLDAIEQAFQARADSEALARDAANAAHQAELRARRSETRMRQFAADASHELRTPLTTIRGFAELYRQGAARDPAEVARLMRRIEDEAQRMGLLVDDLLLLARLDQERPLEQIPVDLRVVAADAVAAAHVVAPARPVSLDVVTGTGPLIVTGDELRIRQVVSNLMTNALTYTPAETPVVLRLSADVGSAGRLAQVDVVDSGPGLDDDHMAHAFERFYRGDTARTRRAEGGHSSGTGLGLAIVAALVKAHGGTVEARRTPGGGATFRVRLPLEQPHTGDESDDADESDRRPGNHPNGSHIEHAVDRRGDEPGDHPADGSDDRGEPTTNVANEPIALPKK
ncbi:MAG TPA: HAMP domain-containing sensor histidine kinase [Micromonosporaceae bacterium]|nr:HAMP domain-containing sensor histidine kinase [Micromonosporaceae bacterium]